MASPAPVSADFEEFMRGLYPGLVAGLGAACGDIELAKDLAQDAFLKAFERWDRVAQHQNPAAWVQLVARNCLIDHRRREQRIARKAHLLGDIPIEAPEEPDLDIRSAVARLTDAQRMTLVAYYFADMSVTAIAELCGVPPGTVKWRLSAGREVLRAAPELAHE